MINTAQLAATIMPSTPLVGGLGAQVDPADLVGGGDDKKPKTVPRGTIKGGALAPDVDPAALVGPNFVPTKDPNVVIGRNGVVITKAQYDQNQKSNLPFNSFADYAHWVGGWAHPEKPIPQIQPYYRTYPAGKISGGDIMQLYGRHDPKIDAVLERNMSKPGEVPQYGPEDSDTLRMLIARNNSQQ